LKAEQAGVKSALGWLYVWMNGLPALLCIRSQERIDDAVNQGLSILAGLALGSSGNGLGLNER